MEETHFKVQVITRAFYEDAYLDFFIKYYLALGFDRIVILKADKPELGDYKLPTDLTENEKERIIIKYVENKGNEIYKEPENALLYLDKTFKWSLHIDADEFLVYDFSKYKTIKEYIIGVHQIMNKELHTIDDIKFRWMCINKLNDKWTVNQYHLNNTLANQTDTLANQTDTTTKPIFKSSLEFNQTTDLTKFAGYLWSNNMEGYRFVKTLYQPEKVKQEASTISAHNMKYDKREKPVICIDNKISKQNSFKHVLFTGENAELNYCNGFILHFNTRSYSNSLTKCLTTKLRDNKKIANLPGFIKFINELSVSSIAEMSEDEKNKIKAQYKKYLNSKAFFPNKISNYNKRLSYLFNWDAIIKQVKSVLTDFPNKELIENECFVNLEIEQQQLMMLCKQKGLNYENIKTVLALF